MPAVVSTGGLVEAQLTAQYGLRTVPIVLFSADLHGSRYHGAHCSPTGYWNERRSIYDHRRSIRRWTALLQGGDVRGNHMNRMAGLARVSMLMVSTVVFAVASGTALAADESEVQSLVEKWVADLNKGDLKSSVAPCAPHAAVVDAFPPYAWQTCSDWMNDYVKNNQATHAPLGPSVPM